MFAITIAFGVQSWRLLYRTSEKAEQHFVTLTQPNDKTASFAGATHYNLEDDFGQRAVFKLDTISAVMFENLDESKIANIELALHQTRTQVEGQKRAEADPALRAAGARRGPSVIDPTMNGQRFS